MNKMKRERGDITEYVDTFFEFYILIPGHKRIMNTVGITS